MAGKSDPTGGMAKLSKKTRAKVDTALVDKELAVLKRTDVDMVSLRPKVSDPESFDKFVEAVNQSNKNNESLAQLRTRLESLGGGVLRVAKEVIGLVK